jgi:predicted alpha-1,6-mannanase (GH76 family)
MFSRLFPTYLLAFLAISTNHFVHGQGDYLSHAVDAARVLQKWYNQSNGLYNTTGWWNSANCITVLADLTSIDPQISVVTGSIWSNTFGKAQKYNLHQAKSSNCPTAGCPVVKRFEGRARMGSRKRSTYFQDGMQIEDANPKGFLNGFFDDEGWWASAWMKVYDLTGESQYLKAAEQIFEDIRTQAANATCGGVWWDRARTANTAISNELFMSVAANLACRVPTRKDFYMDYAVKEWEWFSRSGLINAQNRINDGIDVRTCNNDGKETWSYNQGVILGALVEMNKLQPNASYIQRARDIADATIENMTDGNGILHDPREPNLGGDGNQFKGIFARHLKELYMVTKNPAYKIFLEKNADSVWEKARNQTTGIFTPVWSGPFDLVNANAASHSSGMDALVAAAAVQ